MCGISLLEYVYDYKIYDKLFTKASILATVSCGKEQANGRHRVHR